MDSFFPELYDGFFPFKQQTFRFLKGYLKNNPAHILDIGCGTGAYLAEFARQKHHAIGIDPEPGMIEQAKKRGTNARFYVLPAQELGRLEEIMGDEMGNRVQTFDMIYSIGNVLSFLNTSELEELWFEINRRLRPGGFWIFQIVNWDLILGKETFEFPIIQHSNGKWQLKRRYREISRERVIFELEIKEAEKMVYRSQSVLYPHSIANLKHLHGQAGLIFADFAKNEYTSTSSAIIAVMKKLENRLERLIL